MDKTIQAAVVLEYITHSFTTEKRFCNSKEMGAFQKSVTYIKANRLLATYKNDLWQRKSFQISNVTAFAPGTTGRVVRV